MIFSKWLHTLALFVLLFHLNGCQLLTPKAVGLTTLEWPTQNYSRQDQVEVQLKSHSFSFLLYQQQNQQQLELLGLSLTGQPLFRLYFDGEKVNVEQRIAAMRMLPFDFMVRDLLFATYPNFAQINSSDISIENQASKSTVFINDQKTLIINQQQQMVVLENVLVPYQMVLSNIQNTLENQ